MIFASSSGGSWGQEKRALFVCLITCPWHSPSTEGLLASLSVPQPGRVGTGSWESCAWRALAGCELGCSPFARPLQLSQATELGFAVWVLAATPGQPERVESLPERRRELGAPLPMDSMKEICHNVHIPAPRHSSCPILVMPWQLHSPTVLCGPKDLRRAGSIICQALPHVTHTLSSAHGPRTWPTALHPTTLHAALPGRLKVLTPLLCRLLFCPQKFTPRSLCWHPGAPSTAPFSEHRLCCRWPLMLSCCQLWGRGSSPGCGCVRTSPTKCQGTRKPMQTHTGRFRGDDSHQKHGACLSIRNISSALAQR